MNKTWKGICEVLIVIGICIFVFWLSAQLWGIPPVFILSGLFALAAFIYNKGKKEGEKMSKEKEETPICNILPKEPYVADKEYSMEEIISKKMVLLRVRNDTFCKKFELLSHNQEEKMIFTSGEITAGLVDFQKASYKNMGIKSIQYLEKYIKYQESKNEIFELNFHELSITCSNALAELNIIEDILYYTTALTFLSFVFNRKRHSTEKLKEIRTHARQIVADGKVDTAEWEEVYKEFYV